MSKVPVAGYVDLVPLIVLARDGRAGTKALTSENVLVIGAQHGSVKLETRWDLR